MDGTTAYPLSKEDNIGLYQPSTFPQLSVLDLLAFRHLFAHYSLLHLPIIVLRPAINASLSCKAPVRFNNELGGDARTSLKRVNILRKADVQFLFVGEELDERVCWGGPELRGLHLLRERVN